MLQAVRLRIAAPALYIWLHSTRLPAASTQSFLRPSMDYGLTGKRCEEALMLPHKTVREHGNRGAPRLSPLHGRKRLPNIACFQLCAGKAVSVAR